MKNQFWLVSLGSICAAGCLFTVTSALSTEPPKKPVAETDGEKSTDSDVGGKHRLSMDMARDRAQVMHEIYFATLEMMHDRYFHGDRAAVPARAMQDVFSTIQRQSKIEARWISVNTKPMSIDHAPEGAFEKQAAKEISAGKEKFEAVEDGYYRRAGAIPLSGGCVSCHTGFFNATDKRPKFAGLVISVPIRKGESLQSK